MKSTSALLVPLVSLGCTNIVDASDPAGRFEEVSRLSGGSWRGFVGDVNGDGLDDVAVDMAEGHAMGVVLGRSGDVAATEPAIRITVSSTDADPFYLAYSLGDVNDDGYGDVFYGDALAGIVVFGQAQPTSVDVDGSRPFSTAAGFSLGESIAVAAGDVDGDGIDDLLLRGQREYALIPGRSDWTGFDGSALPADALTLANLSSVADSVYAIGDFNGDGFGDVATTTPEGGVRLHSGASLPWGTRGAILDTDLGSVEPAAPDELRDRYGNQLPPARLHPLGDVNEDGRSDFIVGHLHHADHQSAVLVWGSDVVSDRRRADLRMGVGGLEVMGPALSVSAPGDIDGDGVPEVVFGGVGDLDGNWMDELPGLATRVQSPTWQADVRTAAGAWLPRPGNAVRFGRRVSGGDFDGDGLTDLITDYAVAVDPPFEFGSGASLLLSRVE